MKTTVRVDVNINSPHIGQSHSVERSMHLCDPSRAIDMHTPHFYFLCQHQFIFHSVENRATSNLAMEKVLPKPLSDSTNPAIIAMIYGFSRVVVPQFTLSCSNPLSVPSHQEQNLVSN